MRPEDVELSPSAQRIAHTRGIDVRDVRHARATGQPVRSFRRGAEEIWQVVGSTPDGRRLVMFCSPLELVTWVTEL
jgi:hypothetical protein